MRGLCKVIDASGDRIRDVGDFQRVNIFHARSWRTLYMSFHCISPIYLSWGIINITHSTQPPQQQPHHLDLLPCPLVRFNGIQGFLDSILQQCHKLTSGISK